MTPGFIVRAFPSDAAAQARDLTRVPALADAIDHARNACLDVVDHYRQVIVTDDTGMVWAVFNMLWAAA